MMLPPSTERRMPRSLRIAAPILVGIAMLLGWEFMVAAHGIPVYVLPAPSTIWTAFVADFASLMQSAWHTLRLTIIAFALAVAGGVAIAVLFSQSRTIETAFYPYAVTLQVTPVVAIAPLILIWVGLDNAPVAIIILAWIVAFFPILSNMTLGLRSADPGLKSLFALYGADRWQTLLRLRLPAALPYLLSAMKVAGGLALIGVVVAEFVAGAGTSPGLAWRILEAGNRLQTAKMFASLVLLAVIGILIFAALSGLEKRLLARWHESAREAEG
jgi:NitT/TauT family transport system permease protein